MVGKAFPLDSLKAALRREKGLCLLSGTAPFRTIPAARQRPKPLRSLLHRLYRKERLGFLCRTLADTGKLHPVDDLPLCFRPVSEKLRQNVLCLLHLRIRSADSGKHIAEELKIDEVYCGLLPGDKVDMVEKLLNETSEKGKLIFVGDGINDAPVISRADIGIAMGAGSDAAIEAADIVLMNDKPSKISDAINISKKTLKIVYQNIIFALTVKIVILILGSVGLANMWAAVFADVGVSVIAILNAMRCMKINKN